MTKQKEDKILYESSFGRVLLKRGKYLTVYVTDSVALLVYNQDTDRVMLVNQARLAMESVDNPEGRLTELLAGRCDAGLSPAETMAKEAAEEAGIYEDVANKILVSTDRIRMITQHKLALSAGVINECAYLGFLVIDNSMIEAEEKPRGVGENESVSRVWISARDFMDEYQPKCARVMLMQLWFTLHHEQIFEGATT